MMNRVVTLFLLLFIGNLSPIWAQPAIEFATEKFDFGVAYPNNKLVHQFEYKNTGSEMLIINDVRTTCGCTAAVLSATTIPANGTGIISVTMSTSAPGKMEKSASVYSNDPKKPEIMLNVLAQVRNIWQWTPKSSYSFQNVAFNSSDEMELTLTNIEGKPFEIVGYRVSRPEFFVEHSKVNDDTAKIKVRFESGTVKETVTDSLEIRTDNPNQPIVQITLFGQVVGNIKYDRQTLYFSSVKAGTTVTREMTAHYLADDVDDFQITKISDKEGLVTGKVLGKTDDGGIRMSFTFTAPDKPGYQNGELHLETNAPSERLSVMRYAALVRAK